MFDSNLFILVLVAVVSVYFREKVKNVATKEDIGSITERVESVKRVILEKSHISLFRYEKEYEILLEISKRIFSFTEAFNKLLLNFDHKFRDSQEMDSFNDRMYKLREYSEIMKPFFSSDIFDRVIELDTLCTRGVVSHKLLTTSIDRGKSDLAARSMSELDEKKREISHSIDELNQTIRRRIADWESKDNK